MFSSIRKIVAGPKKRTVTSKFDLDFTYIAQTVVAMAYPASGLEQTYRNSIYDVAKYLETEHNSKYLIINVSNRKYDYKVFQNKVKDYVWQDHQAPTLDVLFDVCSDSYQYLKSQNGNGIVCFHCNHGKGRTGTAIICLFFYAGFFNTKSTALQALKFYNRKRFEGEKYGVDQPCQIRYIQYFRQALIQHRSENCRKSIKTYKLVRIQHEGLIQNEYEFSIFMTRDMKTKYNKVAIKKSLNHLKDGAPIMSDIYIEIYQKGWTGSKIIARANINLNYCLSQTKFNQLCWSMIGSKVRISGKHSTNFSIHFFFKQFCKCHEEIQQECQCFAMRQLEIQKWMRINKMAQAACSLNSRQTCQILFPSQCKQVQKQEVQQIQKAYENQAKLDGIFLAQKIKQQYEKIINMAYIGQEEQQQEEGECEQNQYVNKNKWGSNISAESSEPSEKERNQNKLSLSSQNQQLKCVSKENGKNLSNISVQQEDEQGAQKELQFDDNQKKQKLTQSQRIQVKKNDQNTINNTIKD